MDDPDSLYASSAGGDEVLSNLYHEQGFDGEPDLVDDATLTAHIANGEKELFRGMDNGHETNLLNGKYYAGFGMYGNGTYTAYDLPGKEGNALKEAGGFASFGEKTGVVVRMSLKSDAKIGHYEALEKEAQQKAQHLEDNWMNATPQEREMGMIYKDVGRYAAFQGYDAIDAGKPSTNMVAKSGYLVILNRTALRISTKVHKINSDGSLSS